MFDYLITRIKNPRDFYLFILMTLKQIAGLIPTMQSIALVADNVKTIEKKKVKSKDLLSMGVKNIVGTSLIQAESQLISTL